MTEKSRKHYEIESVQKTDPPPGTEGSVWYRYVITQDTNTIQGYRQGNLKAVTGAVKELVEKLNERRMGKRAQVSKPATTSKAKTQNSRDKSR